MYNKGINAIISTILLIAIVVVTSFLLHIWITNYNSPKEEKPIKSFIKIDGYSLLPDGAIVVYVRNIGKNTVNITDVYIEDNSELVLLHRKTFLVLKSGKAGIIIIPAMTIRQNISQKQKYFIKVFASTGELAISGENTIDGKLLQEAKNRNAPLLGLLAHKSKKKWAKHWVIFDYLSGYYRLYENSSNGKVKLLEKGYAPIVTGRDSYDVCNNKPESPIVIVVNPTRAQKDWVLKWRCGIGPCYTCKFYLQKLSGNIEIDFIIFWEDLYIRPSNRYDDWRDHVVRVTAFFNGTYRLAVFSAKGGYEQEFHLGVSDPENMPLESYVYKKPFGAYWYNIIDGYYREIPDKIYYVSVND